MSLNLSLCTELIVLKPIWDYLKCEDEKACKYYGFKKSFLFCWLFVTLEIVLK